MNRTVVTFRNSAFNSSEPKEYYINPGCFGDDVARWLIDQLRRKGIWTAQNPGQEDFGWYVIFRMSGAEYAVVIGYRPGAHGKEGIWICWLERHRSFIASILVGRKRGISPEAIQILHSVLTNSPQFQEVRWHYAKDFDGNHEDLGTPEP